MAEQNTQPEQTTKPHIYWADFIRVSAIFLVVVIHVSSGLLHDWGKIPLSYWMSGNVYNSFARICVPLLFMISGFLLLGKRESLKDFFLKRAAKLAIPFVFWSLIYLFWRCTLGGQICSQRNISRLLLVDGSYYHLWYLYALLGLYLATPLLRLIMIFGDRATRWYFVALWFVFQPGLMLLNELWKIRIGINVPMATGFVAFYILGYLLGEISFPSWAVLFSLLIWVLSTAATAWGTYTLTSQAGKLIGFFNEYLNVTVILASISAFIVLKSLLERKLTHPTTLTRLISSIAAASFGIYLVHALILDIVGGYIPFIHLNVSIGHPGWSIVLVSVIIFAFSYGAVYVMQRIPFVNRLVP